MKLTTISLIVAGLFYLISCSTQEKPVSEPFTDGQMVSLSKDTLRDKIMGGWAGQTIGCTYGGPTEFRYRGTMIQDYQPITWDTRGHQMEL